MKIMTGKTGTPHVTSQQFRQFVESIVGQESYILASGENLEPELQTNNLLKIRSGMMSHHGNLSVVELETYDEVTIQNGTQGMQRIDLVVNRYTRNEETGIEDNEWVVIMGTPVATDPVAPAYTEGNLQEGDLVDDCPVYEVHLDGINVTEVVKLLTVAPNISDLEEEVTELIGNLKIEIVRFTTGPQINTDYTFPLPEGCHFYNTALLSLQVTVGSSMRDGLNGGFIESDYTGLYRVINQNAVNKDAFALICKYR